jgi:sirohydrochlorin ferrochelatase
MSRSPRPTGETGGSDARAILLVDHGSRRAEANAVLEQVAERVRRRRPGWIVRAAHMELAAPTLAEAFDACVAEGAAEIVVHPYFLAPGRHSSDDIPRLVAEASRRHPRVRVRISEPLGVHDRVIDAVLDRIEGT